ncbi:DoxX family membrane protein [Rhizomonospora bruguierae]|uniref:DoxX family membrane protein n=1 Tax=Rhizomonospora bruguierae TaxID=1581705 RepID=UPI001BD1B303|nr:DoxX family membrane protein [Micromonospora sp. NBRC 107566]
MTIQSTTRTVTTPLERAEVPGHMLTKTAARALAVLRVATGFVFLWAFLDKTFGLGYSTPAAKAWINGGSPTKGFLASVDVGPAQSVAHAIAGTWWANTLFMVGMAAVGIALITGVGLRVAAASGALIMGMMWLTEFPLAQYTSAGAPTGSTNPLTDYHLVYAVVVVLLAAAYAGHTWGLGRRWAQLPLVQKHRWLI